MPEHEPHTRRLLILSCSRCKRTDEGLLPALQRYDGPAFRVLRRFLREGRSEAPDVHILSAEHGLISYDTPIAAYDRSMTAARARELRPVVLAQIDHVTAACRPQEVLVCAGRQYLSALTADRGAFPGNANVKVCKGTMGRKLAEPHDLQRPPGPSVYAG